MRIFWLFSGLILAFNAHCFNWSQLWATPDQQGQALMKQQRFKEASAQFDNKEWRATASYRAGEYQQAAQAFESLNNEQGFFNQGNALAKMKAYEKAIQAYNKALAINPANDDALFNKKLLEDLLKNQQKNNKKDDKKDNKKEKSDNQNKEKQEQDESGKSDQSKEQDQQKDDQNKEGQQDQKNKPDKEKQDQKQDEEKPGETPAKPEESKAKPEEEKESSADDREQQRIKDQWLRLIPDDPGGLLREKFLRDHIRRQGGWYQ